MYINFSHLLISKINELNQPIIRVKSKQTLNLKESGENISKRLLSPEYFPINPAFTSGASMFLTLITTMAYRTAKLVISFASHNPHL